MLAQARQQAEAAKPTLVKQAREKALQSALDGLQKAEAEQLKVGEETGARVDRALKESFAAASTPIYFFAMFVGLLGFLLMFMLPELPLRGRQTHAIATH